MARPQLGGGYPAAYRGGAGGSEAFNTRPPRQPRTPPRPANDNLPRPANDNRRGRGALGRAFRLTPLGRLYSGAKLGYELWEMFGPSLQGGDGWGFNGWIIDYDVGPHIINHGRVFSSPGTKSVLVSTWPDFAPGPKLYVNTWVQGFGRELVGTNNPNINNLSQVFQATRSNTLPWKHPGSYAFGKGLETALYPQPLGWRLPLINPMFVPMAQPINSPQGTPRPVPYWALPYRQPDPDLVEQSERGPSPVPRANPNVDPNGFTITSGRATKGAPAHRLQPARGNAKERKFVLALNRGTGFGRLLEIVGEAPDIIDAFYYALPAENRKQGWIDHGKPRGMKARSAAYKLQVVYDHLEEIDGEKLVLNLVENQIEDALYGLVGKGMAEGNRRVGFSAGFTLGPAL